MHDLVADGNSVILIDHDPQILSESDWIIEMGPKAGSKGGQVIAEGTVAEIAKNPVSMIGPFLSGESDPRQRERIDKEEIFQRNHPDVYRVHSYSKIVGGRYSEGQTDGRHRCIRFREDDPDSGKPSACFRGWHSGDKAAEACPEDTGRGDCTCKADRCDADRDQCALYGSDLRQCAR